MIDVTFFIHVRGGEGGEFGDGYGVTVGITDHPLIKEDDKDDEDDNVVSRIEECAGGFDVGRWTLDYRICVH